MLKPAAVRATEKLGKETHTNPHLAALVEAKLCQPFYQPK